MVRYNIKITPFFFSFSAIYMYSYIKLNCCMLQCTCLCIGTPSGSAGAIRSKDNCEVLSKINSKFVRRATRMHVLIPEKNIEVLDKIGKGMHSIG